VISVALADDEALVRAGLAMILAAQPDIEVVGDGDAAADLAASARPDIVLMVIRMPGWMGSGRRGGSPPSPSCAPSASSFSSPSSSTSTSSRHMQRRQRLHLQAHRTS
jgi:DNA-binding NarL/FixJ family response regulator